VQVLFGLLRDEVPVADYPRISLFGWGEGSDVEWGGMVMR
jgi:hypothetical protein